MTVGFVGFAGALCLGWLPGSGSGLRVPRLRSSGFGLPASGLLVPGFPGSRVPSSGCRIPECRVPASGFRLLGFGLAASGFGLAARTEGTFRPAVKASACCLVASLVSASRRRARFWPCGTQGQNRFVPECHKASRNGLVCHRTKTDLALCATRPERIRPCGPQGQNADGRGCHKARTPLRPRTSGACTYRRSGLARSRGAPRGLRWAVRQQCRRFANLSQPM